MIYRDAIALIGSDRLAYFQQVVQTISRNKDIEKLDIFLFLDRSLREDANKIMRQHVDAVTQYLPQATIIRREENWGCGKNIIDARRHLFDRLGYDKVFIVEDDMLLSDTYFSYCLNLLNWGRERYGNIGAVQGWYKCFLSKEEKLKWLGVVRATFISNWWGYVITHECWNDIRGYVYEFENDNLNCNYWDRDHKKIVKWFKSKFISVARKPNQFLVDTDWEHARNKVVQSPPTGQDAITSLAMHATGYVRLAPVVNRGQYVGEVGIHMHPNWFRRERFNEVVLHPFSGDAMCHSFKPFSDDMVKYLKESPSPIEGLRMVTQ